MQLPDFLDESLIKRSSSAFNALMTNRTRIPAPRIEVLQRRTGFAKVSAPGNFDGSHYSAR